jgi:hypothetical protein
MLNSSVLISTFVSIQVHASPNGTHCILIDSLNRLSFKQFHNFHDRLFLRRRKREQLVQVDASALGEVYVEYARNHVQGLVHHERRTGFQLVSAVVLQVAYFAAAQSRDVPDLHANIAV